MDVDIYPVKCRTCEHDVVIGVDKLGNTWGFCPQCQQALPIIEIALDVLEHKIPKSGSENH